MESIGRYLLPLPQPGRRPILVDILQAVSLLGRLFVPVIGGKSADKARPQLGHMFPEPLGAVGHAATGVVAPFDEMCIRDRPGSPR